jgi:hypothetical protein
MMCSSFSLIAAWYPGFLLLNSKPIECSARHRVDLDAFQPSGSVLSSSHSFVMVICCFRCRSRKKAGRIRAMSTNESIFAQALVMDSPGFGKPVSFKSLKMEDLGILVH